jgi:hypothetical protein
MKTDGNRKDCKGDVPVSLNPYAIIIGESQERVEQGRGEKESGLLLPIHMPWQKMGYRKE